MQATKRKKFLRKLLFIVLPIIILLAVISGFAVNYYIEPVLRNRIHTLIIEGSDSLYTYELGKLEANVFGGNVRIQDLRISVDSNRYKLLKSRNELPAITLQMNMREGRITGIGILPLFTSKKISMSEIMSKDADIKILRHGLKEDTTKKEKNNVPLWKAMQPKISSISIGSIRFQGIKLLYQDALSEESSLFQFGRCDAVLNDIAIDSLATLDTARIGFMKSISFLFNDLRYQTADSVYKMKAEWVAYSSDDRKFAIENFHLEPTLPREEIVKRDSIRRTIYDVLFKQVRLTNIRIDKFIRNNIVEADSIIFQSPTFSLYLDKGISKGFDSKIGKFPHQQLLKARATIRIKHFRAENLQLKHSEKHEQSGEVGGIELKDADLSVNNITNDRALIRANPLCNATAKGILLGSPLNASFTFYLDSANGRFDMSGSISNVTAEQINPVSLPLANVNVKSLNIKQLMFFVTGEDFIAHANVRMIYNNVDIAFRKRDAETGANTTRKFLTKIFNRFVIHPQNPGYDGIERKAERVAVARLTTQSFFGFIWKAVFAGMQNILLKSGRVD
ncbi:MAG TPA: hypothetical protein VM368_03030 [Flavisolibacter sp.]|nr:hypothetical protein [Flavisolibacter sp.]